MQHLTPDVPLSPGQSWLLMGAAATVVILIVMALVWLDEWLDDRFGPALRDHTRRQLEDAARPTLCLSAAAMCMCRQDSDHAGNHRCVCGSQWTIDDDGYPVVVDRVTHDWSLPTLLDEPPTWTSRDGRTVR